MNDLFIARGGMEMINKVRSKHGVSLREARQLISDAAERIELALDGDGDYTDEDVLETVDDILAEEL